MGHGARVPVHVFLSVALLSKVARAAIPALTQKHNNILPGTYFSMVLLAFFGLQGATPPFLHVNFLCMQLVMQF